MRKILLFTVIFFFFGINTSFAAWYGKTAKTYSNASPVMTSCPSDGDVTGGTPTGYPNDIAVSHDNNLTPSPIYNTYSLNSGLTNAIAGSTTTGTMYCLKWDGAAPSGAVSYSTTAWTNGNVTVSITCSDTGGSGCNIYAISGWTISGNTYSRTFTANTSGSITLKDKAGLTKVVSYSIGNIDKTPPTLSDITSIPPTKLLANSSYIYNIGISTNGGAPIVSVSGNKENRDNELSTNFTDTSSPLSISWDIRKVDNFRTVDSNTARSYKFTLTKICDAAGNCWSGTKNYFHNVYADTNNITTKEVRIQDKDNLEDNNNIADGSTAYPVVVKLIDKYWNRVIPAPGINRTIDFNYDVHNTTDLDQYKKTGDAIFVSIPSATTTYNSRLNKLSGVITSFTSQPSTNGLYTFRFKVYTPTANSYSKAIGNFVINSITYDINGSLGNKINQLINNSNIVFKFGPLYTTNISGDLDTFGFLEGTKQKSRIDRTGGNIYLEYGHFDGTNHTAITNLELGYNKTGGDSFTTIQEPSTTGTYFGNVSSDIYTMLTQSGEIPGLQNTYLSTHIKYFLNGKSVVYNSDVVGIPNYWQTSPFENTTQVGVKILGKTYSEDQNNLTNDQDTTDIHTIAGDITQSELKADIKSNAYNMIRNIDEATTQADINKLSGLDWDELSNDGKILDNGKVLYLGELNGANVTLYGDPAFGDNQAEGSKTIIIEGGNLYITSDIINSDSSSILGIVVLADKDGNGGNIYIDPKVLQINAVMYADKALIGYDGTEELDGNTSQLVLRDQLYIKGSVFSNNTIGGSRADPIQCPYYIDEVSCDRVVAQKYDLNYLRRYFLYDSDSDGTLDTPANGGKNYLDDYDVNSYVYAAYPIVIEYNSLIQTTPPPLFSK